MDMGVAREWKIVSCECESLKLVSVLDRIVVGSYCSLVYCPGFERVWCGGENGIQVFILFFFKKLFNH